TLWLGSLNASRLATETEEVEGVCHRPNAAVTGTKVVTRGQLHGLYAPRDLCGGEQQFDVAGPAARGYQWLVAGPSDQVSNYTHPVQAKRTERVRHARNLYERAEHPRSNTPETPYLHWRALRQLLFAHHDVCTAFEPLHEVGDMLGLVGEVCLHGYDCIAPRIAGARGGLSEQGIHGGCVAHPLLAAHY